jgi:hypothetical protein
MKKKTGAAVDSLVCATAACSASDAQSCCDEKAKCTPDVCALESGHVALDGIADHYCASDTCTKNDVPKCCKQYEHCTHVECAEVCEKHGHSCEKNVTAQTLYCAGPICDTSKIDAVDIKRCCKATAKEMKKVAEAVNASTTSLSPLDLDLEAGAQSRSPHLVLLLGGSVLVQMWLSLGGVP